MLVRPGQHVSGDGRVYHPYLANFGKFWDVSPPALFLSVEMVEFHYPSSVTPSANNTQQLTMIRNLPYLISYKFYVPSLPKSRLLYRNNRRKLRHKARRKPHHHLCLHHRKNGDDRSTRHSLGDSRYRWRLLHLCLPSPVKDHSGQTQLVTQDHMARAMALHCHHYLLSKLLTRHSPNKCNLERIHRPSDFLRMFLKDRLALVAHRHPSHSQESSNIRYNSFKDHTSLRVQ